MTKNEIYQLFPLSLPMAKDGKIWNGKPDEFSNIQGMNYSQYFGDSPYSKQRVKRKNSDGVEYEDWMYGTYNGKRRPHNGHDLAGPEGTQLVLPCPAWVSYVGFDTNGYGWFIFFETESITRNGDTIKMEYVLAHMKEKPSIEVYKWHEKGTLIGYVGSTGMSSGPHTHWGGRPWIKEKDGTWRYLFNDEEGMSARGYIDLEPCLDTPLIYDKQILINAKKQFMKLIQKKGENDIYAIGNKDGKAHLILNFASYQKGLTMGMWEDSIEKVDEIPTKGNIIILVENN